MIAPFMYISFGRHAWTGGKDDNCQPATNTCAGFQILCFCTIHLILNLSRLDSIFVIYLSSTQYHTPEFTMSQQNVANHTSTASQSVLSPDTVSKLESIADNFIIKDGSLIDPLAQSITGTIERYAKLTKQDRTYLKKMRDYAWEYTNTSKDPKSCFTPDPKWIERNGKKLHRYLDSVDLDGDSHRPRSIRKRQEIGTAHRYIKVGQWHLDHSLTEPTQEYVITLGFLVIH